MAEGSLQITAAIVDANSTIKPIALHELQLRRATDSAVVSVRTGLDGRAQASLPLGGYILSSVRPATVDGTQYRWQVAVQVSPGKSTTIELTNLNADSTKQDAVAGTGREVASEMKVFGRVREGVVKVHAGLKSGTAFLVDSTGLLLTNAHVVSGVVDDGMSVMLDSVTRVPAQIVARAQEADIAVIRINPSLAQGRPVAKLGTDTEVRVGERVFALGYPLHQELTLTSGIVSGLREGAVISDVNINPGNSGGPLYAMDGSVVAINTFLVAGQYGPGVYGSIPIAKATGLLEKAKVLAPSMPEPGTAPLPVAPRSGIPVSDVKATVEAQPKSVWDSFTRVGLGRFFLDVQTPYQVVAFAAAQEALVAKDRKKREERAGLSQEQRFSEVEELYDWMHYAGQSAKDRLVPVVAFRITPKVGETSGSIWRRLAVAATVGVDSKATYRYKGDLRSAAIYRNLDTVVPFVGGSQPVKVFQNDTWVDLRDVANTGYYMLPVETFAPEADGTPPVITVVVQDLKNPEEPSCTSLKPELVAAVWNQFEGHLRASGAEFVASDPRKKRTNASQVEQAYCRSLPGPAAPKAF